MAQLDKKYWNSYLIKCLASQCRFSLIDKFIQLTKFYFVVWYVYLQQFCVSNVIEKDNGFWKTSAHSQYHSTSSSQHKTLNCSCETVQWKNPKITSQLKWQILFENLNICSVVIHTIDFLKFQHPNYSAPSRVLVAFF